jgi:A118 family predicted phage portal protein
MSIFNRLKQAIGLQDYKKIFGDVDMTSEMLEWIDYWRDMQTGNAAWNMNAASIGVPAGICREFADVAVNEMTVKSDNEKIQEAIEEIKSGLNESLQDGLALGSMVIKPYLKADGTVGIEFVTADRYIPIKFSDTGEITDIAFIQTLKKSVSEKFYRVERHTLTPEGLKITNRAFSGTLEHIGAEMPLTSVPEWSGLLPEVVYPIHEMDFGYYKNPVKNRIDFSPCGVSIYNGAEQIIERVDKQAARIDWEFQSGERAIHVDERALKHRKGHVYMPELNNRLYRGLDLDAGNQELLKEYSPTLRQADLIQGLESYLRQIEFITGLSYGDLSNVNEVDKTAEEIRASKQRKYNRVNAIQNNLKKCIEELTEAIAFYSGLYNVNHEVVINFEDSILTDEKAAREQDRQDVAMGVMRLEEYRAKWYGEDIETAEKNLPEISTVFEV